MHSLRSTFVDCMYVHGFNIDTLANKRGRLVLKPSVPSPTSELIDLFRGATLLFLVLAVSLDCPYIPFYDLGGLLTFFWYVPLFSLTHSIGYPHSSWNSPFSPYVPIVLSSLSLFALSRLSPSSPFCFLLSPCTLSTFPTFLYFP
jgi:hypothetical protein